MKPWFDSEERLAALSAAARKWEGTPFFPHGKHAGPRGGVSCESLASCVYIDCGLLPKWFVIPRGPLDWCNAQKRSLIEGWMDRIATNYFAAVPAGEPPVAGDLVGFKMGGCVHHLGVMLAEPEGYFMHCLKGQGTILSLLHDATWLKRLGRVWRPIESDVHGQG